MLALDHLAVAAEVLEDGRAWVEEALGVSLQQGGQHVHFGTHNMLLGLDDGLYLEVITIDPAARAPGYPRWFDLDRFKGPPRLNTWICQTISLDDALQTFPNAGNIVDLARGDLQWKISVPGTGILPFDNRFPALIEWPDSVHPSPLLKASGCGLERLIVSHPLAQALQSELSPHLSDPRVVYEPGDAGLRAEFMTPNGARVLE